MPITTAAQDQIRFLHHYQPFGLDWTSRLEKILREKSLYFSSPASFNDPWDCCPWFDLDSLSDPEVREQHINWFAKVGINPREGDLKQMRYQPELLRAMVEQCATGLSEKIASDFRIFCVTPDDSSLLMWSHYAKSHQGICLQFDAQKPPFSDAAKIAYQETLPLSVITESQEDALYKAVLIKSSVWSYEREYRVVVKSDRIRSQPGKMPEIGQVPIDPTALIRIIVGAACTDVDQIVAMVEQHHPSVAVRQAIRLQDRFGIGFRTVYPGR